MTWESIGQEAFKWGKEQGTNFVLLACILVFMAYDKVNLQPARDQIQRDAYKAMQDAAFKSIETFMDRQDKASEQWREALLNAKGIKLNPLDPTARVERPSLERIN